MKLLQLLMVALFLSGCSSLSGESEKENLGENRESQITIIKVSNEDLEKLGVKNLEDFEKISTEDLERLKQSKEK